MFTKSVKCTGIILTKLDGTSKGGAIFAIKQKIGLPVKFIGVGEGIDDLEPFDPDDYVRALFE
jgi:fused signal recognition particle receptor